MTLASITQAKLTNRGKRDKIVQLKITIHTAEMLVEASNRLRAAAQSALAALEVANIGGESLYAAQVTQQLRDALLTLEV